ncbi:MAG TPA: hypothetical protein IAC89_01645 [Candidatus Aphodousia faecalis]|nr:hypothetical protein [Candidatus Aphodousia faecalis]
MTWHLKDRELEKKLIEICPNFLECIDFAIQTKEKDADYIYIEFDRERENVTLGFNYLYFWDDELEDILEYNPHAWNEYPDVTPPFDKDMRVELDDGLRYCARYHKFSDGCFWVGTSGTCFPNYLNDKVVRFRPWED